MGIEKSATSWGDEGTVEAAGRVRMFENVWTSTVDQRAQRRITLQNSMKLNRLGFEKPTR
jgi:uncharacterized membrane protein